jgi:hypothetical protein
VIDVRTASVPADPTRPNEDCHLSVPGLVAVFDGVSIPDGMESGCLHGPAWYSRRLAAGLATAHASEPQADLSDLLATSIGSVRDAHGNTCDLDHPGTPQSTVVAVRAGAAAVDYLVLCDSTLVLDHNGRTCAITDARLRNTARALRRLALAGASPIGSTEQAARIRALTLAKREHANRPGGYWIAAADPAAAHHAMQDSVPLGGADRLTRAALLTDGASCVVDQYALTDWRGLLEMLHLHGPHHVVALARATELADPDGYRRPRPKHHDDATIAYCRFDQEVHP